MADTKITALAAITVVDPAADVLPIVDISDTSMAASGTTKKITSNQILGSGGTATLASATITGDLTVDTNVLKVDSTLNKVGIGVATLTGLSTLNVAGDIALTSDLVVKNSGGTVQGYIFGSSGLNYRVVASNPHVWQEGGTDLMRLNSTGLGVGGIVTGTGPTILVEGTAGTYAKFNSKVGAKTWSAGYRSGTLQYEIQEDATERFVIANGGNVGLGTAPSAWGSGLKSIDLGPGSAITNANSTSDTWVSSNAYYTTQWLYKNTAPASYYQQASGAHRWFNAPSGTAGNPITFVQAMTLDASGNLLVGVTSANASGGVLQLKSGITFPATQVASSDANTLDDYEEGTWSPTVGASSGTPTTVTVNAANYTKIGRVVVVNFDFSIVNKGTATSALQFSLPFNHVGSSIPCGAFRENVSTGKMGQVIYNSASNAGCLLYDNTTVWVDGYRIQGTYTYFAS